MTINLQEFQQLGTFVFLVLLQHYFEGLLIYLSNILRMADH